MPTPVNLLGQRFGRLTVLSRAENCIRQESVWICRCDCGNEKPVSNRHLASKNTKSCGCLNKEACKNLVGMRFGRLLVTGREQNDKYGRSRWACLCDCGVAKVVGVGAIKNSTKSCGCLRKETTLRMVRSPERRRKNSERQKGEKSHRWKGGLTAKKTLIRNSAEYKNWRMAVFVRDDYCCQDCGVRGGELHAHHLKAFAFFPELRFEVSNGQTLCLPCHKKTPNYKAHQNVVG